MTESVRILFLEDSEADTLLAIHELSKNGRVIPHEMFCSFDRLGSVKGFLLKPFTAAKLLTMLHDALHNGPIPKETVKA